MAIWIQVIRKRGPHSYDQIRELEVLGAISQGCDLLLCVAEYEWNLQGVNNGVELM